MLKRMIWSTFLRPSYSLFVVLIFFILGSCMLVGLAWNSSAEEDLLIARNQWGLKAIVQVNAKNLFEAKANKESKTQVPSSHLSEEKEAERFLPSQEASLTLNQADKISELTEVKSAQYLSVTNAIGRTISPVIPAGSSSESLEVTEGLSKPQFQLIGVLKSEVLDEFKNFSSVLISGSDISPADLNTNNAIIEHSLAEKNHLKLGDSFEVSNIDGKHSETFIVSGIFVSSKYQNTGLSEKLSFLSNKNQIIVSVSAMSELKGGTAENPVIDKAVFTLKRPGLYESFRIKTMKMGLNLPVYDIYSDDSQFTVISNQMEKINSICRNLTIAIFITIFVFTYLMVIYTKTRRAEEIKTLLLFGESNRKVFIQFLVEIIILILVGFILAWAFSPITLTKITDIIKEGISFLPETNVDNIVRNGKFFIDGSNRLTVSALSNLSLKLNLRDQFGLILIGLFLSTNASVLSLIGVLRMSKKNLFMDSDLEDLV